MSLFVLTRSGAKIPFDLTMLEQSLQRAAQEIGEQDAFAVRSVAEKVAERVLPLFDATPEVATTDIQSTVVASLQEQGKVLLAQAYERHHEPAPRTVASTPAPIVAPAPVVQPVLTTVGEAHAPRRRRLTEERKAITHKFRVGDQEGYITVGLYDDGQPGEIFLKMSKEGTMLSGLMDCFATSISLGLQYGVPLKILARKFMNVQFAPNGETENPNIPTAHSMIDYVFRWLALKFLTPEERQAIQEEVDAHPHASSSSLEESIGRLSI